MWWVEAYNNNESNETASETLDKVDSVTESHFKKMEDDMQLYRTPLQDNMTSRESKIISLVKNNTESSRLIKELFPNVAEKETMAANAGKLPGMNENWDEVRRVYDDNFDKPFIRSTADISVEDVKDIDTPHDVDNSNQIEQVDLT